MRKLRHHIRRAEATIQLRRLRFREYVQSKTRPPIETPIRVQHPPPKGS